MTTTTTTTLILTILFASQIIVAQNFEELCAAENTNGTIVDFELYNGTIYSTGFFNTICNEATSYLSEWENNEWKPSSIQLTDPGHSLRSINGKLYIAKYEESIDSNWVMVYDGNLLEKMGEGVYLTTASGFSQLPNIYDIVEFNNKIIACGEFDRVGQQSIKGIMQWNGSSWEALNGGLNGNISNTAPVIFPHQMLVHNGDLYVVGNFRFADGMEVNGIAKWDGSQWTDMGGGFNNTVYSIEIYKDEIIVGGSFTESNGQPLNGIAKWDGTQWASVGFGFTSTSSNDFIFVHTLKEIDGSLFIAGGLKEITYDDNSTEACGGIVEYKEQSVNTFNGGIAGNDIEALIKTDDETLLIGGGVFGNGYIGQANLTTGLNVAYQADEVTVYPNPFDAKIVIQTDVEITTYSITNLYGQIMDVGKLENNTLDLKKIKTGLYLLTLKGKEKNYVHKIVKQ